MNIKRTFAGLLIMLFVAVVVGFVLMFDCVGQWVRIFFLILESKTGFVLLGGLLVYFAMTAIAILLLAGVAVVIWKWWKLERE